MGAKKKSSNWRVLKNGPVFAIVNERTEPDLIADCYSNQTDALTMAASREMLKALFHLGGGDEYIEQCGRLCFCMNIGRSCQDLNHSTACNEAWEAYQLAKRGDK